MFVNKKATFKLEYAAQCKLENIAKETQMSQNKVVNAAIRGLQIVNVEEGKECLKTLYEMRNELKKLKMSSKTQKVTQMLKQPLGNVVNKCFNKA